ncbi:3113_t:CDS:2 [Funneliformis geosporum]|nr:3113_t:CDS:2 [Funneliformis geosporum]
MAKQMREVAEYFIINTISCQWLIVKRNVINEYREIASIAFLSLFDVHYFAGEIKQMETGKYPDTYVFSPIKGLENKHPVTGLDFASLYPNLIMTYNLSPDKIILSRKYAEFLRDKKGLYATILEYLSAKQNEIKKYPTSLKEKKEDMELVIGLISVTSVGQRNIKLVADFIESKGFQKKYEDTDSLYLVYPEECFKECDEEYDSGIGFSKEEY